MSKYAEITKQLDKKQRYEPSKGYYADDDLFEDLQIIPDGDGEFGTYRQCLSFELAGRGFQQVNLDNLKNSYIKTKTKGKEFIEKNQDIQDYLSARYGFDARNI